MRGAAAPASRAALLVAALLSVAAIPCASARASGGGGGGHEAPAAPPKPAPPPPPTPAAAAAPDADQPWRLIRALHRLQARLGEGDAVAQAAQGELVADLGRRFDAAPEAVWDDRRNAAAQMVLLLSGADPRPARRRLDAGAFGDHDAPVRAGLAFAEGDAQAARRALSALDDAPLDPLPRAHASLVAATLIAAGPAADRPGAHALFDRARLLAPGFLPEEAALRRQARLAEELGDRPRFAALAAAYLRRYAGSVYASPFRKRLPQAFAALIGAPEDLAALAPLARALSAPERGAALDAVARAALSKGAPDLAAAAAELWLDAGVEPAARDRAQIYALAAQALRGGPEIAARLAETRPVDPDADALRRAALALARQVTAWPPPPPPTVRDASPDRGKPAPAPSTPAPAVDKAGARLAGRGAAPPDAAARAARQDGSPPRAPEEGPPDPAASLGATTEAKIMKALAEGESLLRAAPRLAPASDASRPVPSGPGEAPPLAPPPRPSREPSPAQDSNR